MIDNKSDFESGSLSMLKGDENGFFFVIVIFLSEILDNVVKYSRIQAKITPRQLSDLIKMNSAKYFESLDEEPVWKNPYLKNSSSPLPLFSYSPDEGQFDHLFCQSSRDNDDNEGNKENESDENLFDKLFKSDNMYSSVLYTNSRLKYIREEGNLDFSKDIFNS
jgi:hypothetical protein